MPAGIEDVFASETSSMEAVEPVETPPAPFHEPEPAATPEEILPAFESEAVPTESSDLPDWLRDLDREEKWPQPVPVDDDEIPAWLQGESEPVSQAEPTQPTDWRPVEATSGLDLTPAEMDTVPEPPQDYLTELQELREQPLETEPEPVLPMEPVSAAVEREVELELEPDLEQEAELEAPQPTTPSMAQRPHRAGSACHGASSSRAAWSLAASRPSLGVQSRARPLSADRLPLRWASLLWRWVGRK